jgi:ribosomal protein S18 acetylase RimI-like enzyme
MSEVTLRPLRDDEFDAHLATTMEWYARDLVEHAGFDAESAARKSREDNERLFSAGLGASQVHVRVIEVGGARAGVLMWAPQERYGRRFAWLYQIEVDPALRGRGIGRRAMELLEEEVRARGLARLELNVFGGNQVARRLYGTLGFDEVAVTMGKGV